MRATLVVLIAGMLMVAGCSTASSTDPVPAIDSATEAELQARTFIRACQDVICAGAPIYAPDTTPDLVRQAILERYTDETEYLDENEREQRTSSEGRFLDGGTLIGVEGVHSTDQDNVIGVNVSISKGYRDHTGRTYLFVWNGTEWADTSPDAVNVTVTSSVS
ncbi:MAG: hypothetical protein MUQ27_02755 [Acidimicrobiia bacterium]|nr:hypothetical protein [Acidimicrobiia bacterium]